METPSDLGARPSRVGRGCLWLVAGLGLAFFASCAGGVAWLGYQIRLESAGQGFGISPAAVRAYQQAQQTRPGEHLLLKGYYPTGSMFYVNAELSSKYDPKKHVKLEVRGVPLVIERGVFEYRHARPYVIHQGDNPTSGFQVKFRQTR